ncbi:SUMF1/EgtB/PvdO family nonheme iron enzyme [Luteimonas sp. RD2P54]|uniref:SUMF1/EgtB/PvdO family nonheme iron enzyme n=1 Tax=Luteimonas endophytica TaxID=3042023 RepID=A0ABT6J5U4_9GAMM|nr:SUMF1/EgtB/PvdO family nonheme iron enzyme [Luteimonas endophytica]MDH5821588.1 SUMF1/EgtB/PvdO family nonheme iron enzyme [Luteimonas endophytica]
MRSLPLAALLLLTLAAGCAREGGEAAEEAAAPAERQRSGSVTVSGDDSIASTLTWRRPEVPLEEGDDLEEVRGQAAEALEQGHLYDDAEAAIPIYLALLERDPDDGAAAKGLERARERLLADGAAALEHSDQDFVALREARRVAAVARAVWPESAPVQEYLQRVDRADRLWELNRAAEAAIDEERYGESGGGALQPLREALELEPGQPRAMQNLAAVESGLIRRAERVAEAGEFDAAAQWLAHAGELRPESATVPDARERIARLRAVRVARLRDRGIAALGEFDGIAKARAILAELLLIAHPGDPAAAELRERISLAVHYGLFRPGQQFTDALESGARGPRMAVMPHGAFTMGAPEGERGSGDSERPQRNIRFDRGFAISVHEVTVGEFRRFVNATGYQTRAVRRGFSMVYDERSGNFVRRSGVDWRSDFLGAPASDDMPVLHVSALDAEAYAQWLAKESGRRYRLPSEAEFEYALRTGTTTPYPWGEGVPPAGAGNFTGGLDRSAGGRSWSNAFEGYGDGHWGPAPVGSFAANRWGVHDLAGNVSEWVADCWHASYRRAPRDASPWINPGCRTHVIRGGSWASAPEQIRSAWRAPAARDTTNARIGFRVMREL